MLSGTKASLDLSIDDSRETVDDGLIGTDVKSGDGQTQSKSDISNVESYQTPFLIKLVISLKSSTCKLLKSKTFYLRSCAQVESDYIDDRNTYNVII